MCSNVKNCWALAGFFPDPQDLLGKNCIIYTKCEKVNLTAVQIYICIYRLPPKKYKLFKWTIVPFISLGLVKQDSVTAKSVVTKQKAEHSGSHQGHDTLTIITSGLGAGVRVCGLQSGFGSLDKT